MSPRDDRGSIMPLVAGFGALCLAVILVVVSATSLYIERKRLFSLADAAALAGAEASIADDGGPASSGPRLETPEVAAAVERYVGAVPSGFEGLRVDDAGALDATSATVTLSAIWRPPILSVFVPDGLRIDVTAVGRIIYY